MVTSDRIVAMNRGLIEQVDDPCSLHNRPRTPGTGGPPLRVAAPPAEILAVEGKVRMGIDPRRVAHLTEES